MQEDKRTLQAYLKSIARHYYVDLPVQRASTGELLDCSNSVPLTFHKKLVLISTKVRKPLSRSDGATGYVNLLSIERVIPAEPNHPDGVRCYLQLKSGHLIPSLHSISNVKSKIRQGKSVHKYHLCLNHDSHTLGKDILEADTNSKNKRIKFSNSLIFKLITDDGVNDGYGGEDNALLT